MCSGGMDWQLLSGGVRRPRCALSFTAYKKRHGTSYHASMPLPAKSQPTLTYDDFVNKELRSAGLDITGCAQRSYCSKHRASVSV